MPIIATFFGILVRMWHDDHPPPNALLDNWARAQRFEPLERIPGADLDD
ncbi:MAG: hypothetical protein ACK4JZ_07850 [Hydrogenophilus thermoluteolus]|nr:hypothetical protein [Hydrogenophilus thermoluteolus]HNU20211.1 hypothetical protein [Hydrogenophilus thermoluteolus]